MPWEEDCTELGETPGPGPSVAPLGELDLSEVAGLAVPYFLILAGDLLGTDGGDLMVLAKAGYGSRDVYFYDEPYWTTFLDPGCWRPVRRLSADELTEPSATPIALADFNGDGSPTLVLSVEEDVGEGAPEGVVLLYDVPVPVFAPLGPGSADATIFGDTGNHHFPADLSVGDSDGDGYADLLMSVTGYEDDGFGYVALFSHPLAGVLNGWEDADSLIYSPPPGDPGGVFGDEDLTGDFNADGCADAVVQGGTAEPVLVFEGPLPMGILGVSDRDMFLALDAPLANDTLAVGAGDLNGDGYSDLTIGDEDANDRTTGEIWSWFGPLDEGFSFQGAAIHITHERGNGFGRWLTTEVDLDGDGRQDLIAGAPENRSEEWTGGVYVFYLPDPGEYEPEDADAYIRGTQRWNPEEPPYPGGPGYRLRPAGDVNGDGYEDLAFGGYDADVHWEEDLDDYLTWVVFGGPR